MTRSRKILLVDDESSIRFLLSDVLSSEGFEVIEAKDGQESVEQLEKDNFDLVITDIRMPRLNGIEVLKWMDKAGRKEKVILMTAHDLDHRVLGGSISRVITQFHKPFKIDNFLDVVIAATDNTEPLPRIADQQ
jgi:DNA-binding NtrC family response regulator